MGVRAFVARSGWTKTPISAQEWHEAAATLPELVLHAAKGDAPARAMLQGSRRSGVVLHQGYLCGEHVNQRLAAVMFVLADRLGAQVYSERRRAYRDVADWAQRVSRHSRRRRQQYSLNANPPDAPRLDAGPGTGAGSAGWMVLAALIAGAGMLVLWALE